MPNAVDDPSTTINGLGLRAPPQHRSLVLREQGALVELAGDLPAELTDASTAAERLFFIEGACLGGLHGEQLDVV
jgi:hypothetical protein